MSSPAISTHLIGGSQSQDPPIVDPLPHQLPFDAPYDDLLEAVSRERDMKTAVNRESSMAPSLTPIFNLLQ